MRGRSSAPWTCQIPGLCTVVTHSALGGGGGGGGEQGGCIMGNFRKVQFSQIHDIVG